MSVLVAVSIRALQLSRESYTVFPASTSIDIKPTHPLYALEAILVTEEGMVIEGRLEQPLNKNWDISVTDDGMLMEASCLQFINVSDPKEVNELPNVTDVRLKKFSKAL